ncbi:MAG: protein translocase subunit SecF, partial [Pseudomonadota bacterium]
MSFRKVAFVLSCALVIASMAIFFVRGLNYGIDFQGGILIEVGFEDAANLDTIRAGISGLGLGDIAVQEFGTPEDVLIRIERQPGDGDAQNAAVQKVRTAMAELFTEELTYRRVEFVGPKVSGQLLRDGLLAVSFAVIAVLIYIWFRFEWQFGAGAVLALVHDVLLTIGFFSITGLEFNLSIIAAILTIVGYSLNDTVVVYDRVRENLRRFKRMELKDLLDLSLNDTLARTLMTSLTTLL